MSIKSSPPQVPAFLIKLKALVDDEETDDFIAWDLSGKSFHIFDGNRLAKEILPLYFKHNNLSSFIRQLNMYGFRKLNRVDVGGVYRLDTDDMEFSHTSFIRGHDEYLHEIHRKPTPTQNFFPNLISKVSYRRDSSATRSVSLEEFSQLVDMVKHMKSRQDTTDQRVMKLKNENEQLYRDMAELRKKHDNQAQVIQSLFTFLTSYATETRAYLTPKRKLALSLTDAGVTQNTTRTVVLATGPSSTSPTSTEVVGNSSGLTPRRKVARLTTGQAETTSGAVASTTGTTATTGNGGTKIFTLSPSHGLQMVTYPSGGVVGASKQCHTDSTVYTLDNSNHNTQLDIKIEAITDDSHADQHSYIATTPSSSSLQEYQQVELVPSYIPSTANVVRSIKLSPNSTVARRIQNQSTDSTIVSKNSFDSQLDTAPNSQDLNNIRQVLLNRGQIQLNNNMLDQLLTQPARFSLDPSFDKSLLPEGYNTATWNDPNLIMEEKQKLTKESNTDGNEVIPIDLLDSFSHSTSSSPHSISHNMLYNNDNTNTEINSPLNPSSVAQSHTTSLLHDDALNDDFIDSLLCSDTLDTIVTNDSTALDPPILSGQSSPPLLSPTVVHRRSSVENVNRYL